MVPFPISRFLAFSFILVSMKISWTLSQMGVAGVSGA